MTKEELKQGTFELCCDLVTELQASSRRIDIRERVAIIAMLLRHGDELWGQDERSAGATARQYQELFAKPAQKAASDPGRAEDAGSDADAEPDGGNGADPESCVPRNID